jgi:hypothetical protein
VGACFRHLRFTGIVPWGLTDVIVQTFHLDGQQMLMAFASFATLFPTWPVLGCSLIYRLFGAEGLLVLALVQSCLGY